MPASLIPAEQFAFCGPTNLSVSPVIDAERAINLYCEPGIASSKTRMGLTGRPGLTRVGATTLAGGFGHSLYPGAGRLFVATGSHVYEVGSGGNIITDYGTGLSNFAPTQMPFVANGTQLLICDPEAGNIFNVNPGGPSLDNVFNGVSLEYLDDFYIAIATGASLVGANPNQLNVSVNGDGTTWPGLAFTFETSAADLIVRLAVLNSLVYIFGQKTLRIWYNAGNAIFPFARINGGVVNLGCLAPASVVKFSNTILWLGSDGTGYGQVYMMQGTNPVRVSNTAIENYIATEVDQLRLQSARAYGYQEAGHTFYVINFEKPFPGTHTTGQTLVYDLTTGLWHERAYAVGGSSGVALVPTGYANVPSFGTAFGPNYVIDEATGQLWYQSIQLPNDGGTGNPITYTRIAPHVSAQRRWTKYSRFELDMDQGNGAIAPILDYSNGRVVSGDLQFLGYNYPLAQAQDQGAAGTAQQFYATQLGRSRDRTFKVTITEDTNLIRIANAAIYAEDT